MMKNEFSSVAPKTLPALRPQPILLLDDEEQFQLPTPPTIVDVAAAEEVKPLLMKDPEEPPVKLPNFVYTAADFAANCENQYNRYIPNSKTIAHLFYNQQTNEAFQFPLPCDVKEQDTPTVTTVKSLMGFTLPNGKTAFRAESAQGEAMLSRRSYAFEINKEGEEKQQFTFFPLSPTRASEPDCYGPFKINHFLKTHAAQDLQCQKPGYVKTSGEMEIVNQDIPLRGAIKTRKPDQNTVMGGRNAVSEYQLFLGKYAEYLTEDCKKILTDAAATVWGSGIYYSQKRPEWLHRHGFRLHPMNDDPQKVENLGAARKCHNTAMMIPERTVERMIQKYPDAKAKICCEFSMLLDSHVVKEILFYVAVQIGAYHIKFTHNIDALEKNPQFVKASDMASIVGVLCMLIQNIAPVSVQKAMIGPRIANPSRPLTLFGPGQRGKREREEQEIHAVIGAPK